MILESDIEAKLVKAVKSKGGLCLKFTSPGFNGVPDRIILLPGSRIYFVELKRPSGTVAKIQSLVHRLFNTVGFPVYVVSTEKNLTEFLKII